MANCIRLDEEAYFRTRRELYEFGKVYRREMKAKRKMSSQQFADFKKRLFEIEDDKPLSSYGVGASGKGVVYG